MLRECVRLAREEQRVIAFVEPIALYMTRDLNEAKDGGWTHLYPKPGDGEIALGQIGQHGEGTDLAIVTYGNGYYLSRQAESALAAKGIRTRIIDLRWLAPLAEDAVLAATQDCAHILVVDECRITGSQSEGLMALFAENGRTKIARLAAEDSFIATGPAFGATLPSRDGIIDAATALVKGGAR